jgi:hypothetical protein
MKTALNWVGYVLIAIGSTTVFIVTAVTAGVILGAGLAVFEGNLDNGKSVTGIGIVSEPQNDTVANGAVNQ